jgi:hypothetical protein
VPWGSKGRNCYSCRTTPRRRIAICIYRYANICQQTVAPTQIEATNGASRAACMNVGLPASPTPGMGNATGARLRICTHCKLHNYNSHEDYASPTHSRDHPPIHGRTRKTTHQGGRCCTARTVLMDRPSQNWPWAAAREAPMLD